MILRHYRYLDHVLNGYGCRIPRRLRVLFVLAFERLSRKARFRNSQFVLSQDQQHRIGSLFAQCLGLLTLLGYDDPFDENTVETTDEYLVRSICGYLAGSTFQFPVNTPDYLERLNVFDELFRDALAKSTLFGSMDRDRERFQRSTFVAGLRRLAEITETDFLFDRRHAGPDGDRNIPIVAAIELGKTFRRLQAELGLAGVPASALQWQSQFIDLGFMRCGFAQAHSFEQHDISRITWSRYCQLAVWKSNSIEDIGSAIRGVLNPDALQVRRFGTNRFCEQIYLDDVHDVREDTVAKILGAAHICCLEQGRLGREVLSRYLSSSWASSNSRHRTFASLDKSWLLTRRFEGAFLQTNADSDLPDGKWADDDEGIRNALRSALANNRNEMNLTLQELLERRVSDSEALESAWRSGNHGGVVHALHRSGVLLRFMRGFLCHLRSVRSALRTGGRPGPGGAGYYLFLQGYSRASLAWFYFEHWRSRTRELFRRNATTPP